MSGGPRRAKVVLGQLSVLGICLVALGSWGCGAHVGGLCGEAAACDYIEADDEAECRQDIHDALAEGDLEKQDVDECLACMRDNECNLDTFVDCNTDCAKVSPYVFGARVH